MKICIFFAPANRKNKFFFAPANRKRKGYALSLSKGFTLIELLVVIAIIGLLASIVLVSLSGARAKARNTKRNADIAQLMTAFNMGVDSSSLPIVSWSCVSSTCYGGWSGYSANSAVDAYLAPYLPQKPDDPNQTGRGYGGYLYMNSWIGGTGYSGYFPPGAYITWVLELTTLNASTCGAGRIWNPTSNHIQCLLKVD